MHITEALLDLNATKIITKVLIANNGMAAVKAIRSIRKWSYETFGIQDAIEFTVMCTPEDLSVNAEFIRMADHYIQVPGGSSNNNYANVDLIVDIAQRAKVDAVWVGWGFASENPILPDKLAALEIVFIGPPSSAMRALGDKIASTIVAQSAQVPCVDWSGSSIVLDLEENSVIQSVPSDLYEKATVSSTEQGLEHAKRIGFPIMIKASEGGGGKGIRIVDSLEKFAPAFVQVMREVPGSPIFVMKVVENARHLEVQLLADEHGNAIALFGRDCSVQRRHQKIIEEAPVSVAPIHVQRAMEQAAVRLAKLVGYTAAGTVEYLYEPDTENFYFLELNPRLQVEHPTTEMVSGVNLPAAQLQVAMGIPLSSIKDIRVLYGMPPNGTAEIDFDFKNPESSSIQRRPMPRGHVVATRITAENPDAGFKPNSGKVMELNFRSNPNVWGYFSVNSSGGVHEYADSQFGHIFSYGETREAARKNLVMALKDLSIRGEFRTTVEYLIVLLEADEYKNNVFTTSWLDKLIANKNAISFNEQETLITAICGGASIGFKKFNKGVQEYVDCLQKGQSPSKLLLSTNFGITFILNGMQFNVTVGLTGPESLFIFMNGSKVHVLTKQLPDDGLLIQLNEKTHVVYAKEEAFGVVLVVDGKTSNLEKERDPSQIVSPSPGKLVRYLVEDGEHVLSGDAIAEIEVMKMYMPLLATEAGVFHSLKAAGSSIVSGDVIGRLILDDPEKVQKATIFSGKLPEYMKPSVYGDKPHQKYCSILERCQNILKGYELDESTNDLVQELVKILRNLSLPSLEYQDILSSISNRIPAQLASSMKNIVDSSISLNVDIDMLAIEACINEELLKLSPDEQVAISTALSPIYTWMKKYENGLKSNENKVLLDLMEQYYQVETLFNANDADVMTRLRDKFNTDHNRILQVSLASSKKDGPSGLVLAILDQIDDAEVKSYFLDMINKLASLVSTRAMKVSLRAREILISTQQPSYQSRRDAMLETLGKASKTADRGFDQRHLAKLVVANYSILDVLCSLFYHNDQNIALTALYTYVLHTYQAYSITQVKTHENLRSICLSWKFVQRTTNAYSSSVLVSEAAAASTGLICFFETIDELENSIEDLVFGVFQPILSKLGASSRITQTNILNIAIKSCASFADDEDAHNIFGGIVKKMETLFSRTSITQVTLLVVQENQFPRYFTFRQNLSYAEDLVIRHAEPAMAHRLELDRLDKFEIKPCFIDNRRVHIYYAQAKQNPSDVRFFIRGIIHPGPTLSTVTPKDFVMAEGTRIMRDILDSIEVLSAQYRNTDCNHVLLNFVPPLNLDLEEIEVCLRDIIRRHSARLFKLRVSEAEIRFVRPTSKLSVTRPARFVISSHSGYVLQLALYQEVRDAKGVQTLMSISSPTGPLHNMPVNSPHQPKEAVQPKRYKAHLMGTTYIYDFPELFNGALKRLWTEYASAEGMKPPAVLCNYTELALNQQGELEPVNREPGKNTCGMVAWQMELFTPEYPEGRNIVVIGNDITFNIGSFGPEEDLLFYQASLWARKRGIPRIYISANSGARIGLADEVSSKFKIAWVDGSNPTRGFDYLYLDEADYKLLSESVTAEKINVDGAVRYKLSSIIGKQHGLGVENLQGSGQIAGETSKAYDEIFTITLVTCRSVGIGAYLVRLGQRTVQVEGAPIILTGASALNKVYGREVYTSNLQLGGTQIMHRNGVSHLVVENDLEGIISILSWLSYVPKEKESPLPVLPSSDAVERDIDVELESTQDPRILLEGFNDENGSWQSGFFDKDSFRETLSGWAKGVIVGRARLGGIPIGVIVTECRTTEYVEFADPAVEASHSQVNLQAGQVWYPNSAFKTAQAIRDFNKGEQLPMIIFANWRGFAGGQSDMHKEVLKFGSYIVDALVDYKQPIFIYLVGELRGGAWVVLDPTINPEMMEMYAQEDARGGVIEPPGVIEIKFRRPKLQAAMERLDSEYRELKQQLSKASPSEKSSIQRKLDQREKELSSIYTNAAVSFADLHDRPGRMVAKKVIKRVVPWAQSRTYFYWRLLRRICELDVIRSMRKADSDQTYESCRSELVNWFISDLRRFEELGDTPEDQANAFDESDVEVVRWINSKRADIEDRINEMRVGKLVRQAQEIGSECPEAYIESFAKIAKQLDPEFKQKLLEMLK